MNDDKFKQVIHQALKSATVKIWVNNECCGTGFFITPDGDVLTAYHCIDGYRPPIEVQPRFGKKLPAQLDEDKSLPGIEYDIAVLKVNYQTSHCLPLGKVSTSEVSGQEIVTLGYPAIDEGGKGEIGLYFCNISRFHGNRIELPDAIKGDGQSGGPVYHYASGRVIALASKSPVKEEMTDTGLGMRFEALFEKWPELQQMNSQVAQAWDKFLKEKNTASRSKSVYVTVAMAMVVIGFMVLVALSNFRHSSPSSSTKATSQPKEEGTFQTVPDKEPFPKEPSLIVAAGGEVAGYIGSLKGTPETFILKRQGKTLPLQIFASLQTGDQIIVTGDSRLELVLVDNKKVEVTKANSPYTVEAVGKRDVIMAWDAIKALFGEEPFVVTGTR